MQGSNDKKSHAILLKIVLESYHIHWFTKQNISKNVHMLNTQDMISQKMTAFQNKDLGQASEGQTKIIRTV